jgi:hypothetical protein
MRVILFLLCAVSIIAGIGILINAQSSIHEIESFVLFLIGSVLLSGASIVESVNTLNLKIDTVLKKDQEK